MRTAHRMRGLVPALALAAARAARLRVGVAVVTYARPAYLARCLENIAAQTYPAALTEVLVVDDTPGDAARAAVEAETGAALRCSRYVHLPGRASIGAKRDFAARELRENLACDVIVSWDDDDVYGRDRIALQVAPIARGAADATVATPHAWRWEGDGAARAMPGGGLLGALLHRVDPELELGTELLDEAIASLCYDARLLDVATYPDSSYDEDRAFLRLCRAGGARLARLPPRAPEYVHVKHAVAAARGPLTELHATGLGALASSAGAAGAVLLATAALKAVAGAAG